MNLTDTNLHYQLSKLPRLYTIEPGKIIFICEDVFKEKKYAGTRKIIAEVMGFSQTKGSVKIKVLASEGINKPFTGSVIERPTGNVLYAPVLTREDVPVFRREREPVYKSGGHLEGVDKNGKKVELDSAKSGGMSVGSKHTEGGIKGSVGAENRPIEFEGEEIILTAPVASDDTVYDFQGKKMTARQIASDLNVKNGGVSFADGGVTACKCSGKTYDFGGKTMSDKQIIEMLNGCGCGHALDEEMEKVKKEHYDALSGLNGGDLSLDQCLKQIARKNLQKQYLS